MFRLSVSSNITLKLSIMALISLTGMLLLSYLFYHAFSDALYQEKKLQSRALTNAGISTLQSYYNLSQQGEMNEAEAQSQALYILQSTHYSENGYFFVNNINGIMLMHPSYPDTIGTSVIDWQDKDGTFIFVELIKAAKQGGGWVNYRWTKPHDAEGTPIPKLTHAELFEPWGWVLGTGLYLDDIQREIDVMFSQTLWVIAIAFFIVLSISMLLARYFSGELKRLAIRDPLTDLFTRRYLNETGPQFVRNDNRDPNHQLYVIFLDIDYFKKINDSYGHHTGDQVLEKLGMLIKNSTRDGDVCVRYGGEEFVILTSAAKADNVIQMTQRLCQKASEICFEEGFHITLSVGISTRDQQESLDQVLQRADQNLYAAKNNGRNCIVTDHSLNQQKHSHEEPALSA